MTRLIENYKAKPSIFNRKCLESYLLHNEFALSFAPIAEIRWLRANGFII